MDLKIKIAHYIQVLLERLNISQKKLAELLEISPSRLSSYLHAKEIPGIEILIRLADLGEITIDDLVKGENEIEIPQEKINKIVKHININGDHNIYGSNNTVNISPTIKEKIEVKSDDKIHISEEEAQKIKELVDLIVQIEKTVSKKPKNHSAVWGAFKKKFKITHYRLLKKDEYEASEKYLYNWIGRLKSLLKDTNEDEYRKKTYAGIFARMKMIGWVKSDLTNYLMAKYEVDSLKDLNTDDLKKVYSYIFSKKQNNI